MRILVVQESDWIEKGPHQSHHLMERLSEGGHDVRVIDFEISWRSNRRSGVLSRRTIYPDVRKATRSGTVTVIRPPFLRIPILDYVSIMMTHRMEISKQIKCFKPDVVIGFGILNASIALRLTRKEEIPFIYYIIDELHRLVPQTHFRGIAKLVEARNMGKSDAVVTICEGLREYALAMGAVDHRTTTITAGIDLDRFKMDDARARTRDELGICNKDIVLFFMGWLYEFSGLEEVATELMRTPISEGSIRLLIVGKGELHAKLATMGMNPVMKNRMTLLDWQPYDRIQELLSAADICILPAHDNAIMRNIVPIKVYEYMASGKPVISTDLYGMMKEFGKGNGVVYVNGPDKVIEAATELIRSGRVAEEGAKARAHMQNYSWVAIARRFERLVNETIVSMQEEK